MTVATVLLTTRTVHAHPPLNSVRLYFSLWVEVEVKKSACEKVTGRLSYYAVANEFAHIIQYFPSPSKA